MAAFNSVMTSIFDVVLIPFELMSYYGPLVVVSGLFGILALILFKRISFQAGIKATKDKIKGHMIAIRIYQDDLVVVGQSVLKVLTRNFQYLGLNFGPILPLVIPFLILAAQFVVRYAYDPVPVQEVRADFMSGEGTMVEVEMSQGHSGEVEHLSIELSDGLQAMTPWSARPPPVWPSRKSSRPRPERTSSPSCSTRRDGPRFARPRRWSPETRPCASCSRAASRPPTGTRSTTPTTALCSGRAKRPFPRTPPSARCPSPTRIASSPGSPTARSGS